jgi:hypothetical protein
METPMMFVVTIVEARWIVQRLAVPFTPFSRLSRGCVALDSPALVRENCRAAQLDMNPKFQAWLTAWRNRSVENSPFECSDLCPSRRRPTGDGEVFCERHPHGYEDLLADTAGV